MSLATISLNAKNINSRLTKNITMNTAHNSMSALLPRNDINNVDSNAINKGKTKKMDLSCFNSSGD